MPYGPQRQPQQSGQQTIETGRNAASGAANVTGLANFGGTFVENNAGFQGTAGSGTLHSQQKEDNRQTVVDRTVVFPEGLRIDRCLQSVLNVALEALGIIQERRRRWGL
jgi:hypothetical protein